MLSYQHSLCVARKVCSYVGPQSQLCGVWLTKKILCCSKVRRNLFSKDVTNTNVSPLVLVKVLVWVGEVEAQEMGKDQRKASNTLWFLLPNISHVLDVSLVYLCQGTANSTIVSTCSDLDCGFVIWQHKQRATFNFMVMQRQKKHGKAFQKVPTKPVKKNGIIKSYIGWWLKTTHAKI